MQYTIKQTCRVCARCTLSCPIRCIHLEGEIFAIDSKECTGCGECVNACPYSAIIPIKSENTNQ